MRRKTSNSKTVRRYNSQSTRHCFKNWHTPCFVTGRKQENIMPPKMKGERFVSVRDCIDTCKEWGLSFDLEQ